MKEERHQYMFFFLYFVPASCTGNTCKLRNSVSTCVWNSPLGATPRFSQSTESATSASLSPQGLTSSFHSTVRGIRWACVSDGGTGWNTPKYSKVLTSKLSVLLFFIHFKILPFINLFIKLVLIDCSLLMIFIWAYLPKQYVLVTHILQMRSWHSGEQRLLLPESKLVYFVTWNTVFFYSPAFFFQSRAVLANYKHSGTKLSWLQNLKFKLHNFKSLNSINLCFFIYK